MNQTEKNNNTTDNSWSNIKRMTNLQAVQKALDLALGFRTVYVNGMLGETLTNNHIERTKNYTTGNAARAENRKTKTDYGYFGFDCSGMIKALLLWNWNGNRKPGEYEIIKEQDINQDGLREICTNLSPDFSNLDNILPGEYLYQSYNDQYDRSHRHCGLYIGNGFAVECTTDSNYDEAKVRITQVLTSGNAGELKDNKRKWTEHGRLPFLTYLQPPEKTPLTNNQLSIDKREYLPGENIHITVSNLNDPIHKTAYVRLYKDLNTNTDYYQDGSSYGYLNTWCYVSTGSHTTPSSIPLAKQNIVLKTESNSSKPPYALPEGKYKVVLYSNEQVPNVLAKVDFRVSTPRICDAICVDSWIEVTISSNIPECSWIGLYEADTIQYRGNSIAWHYATGDVTAHEETVNSYPLVRIRIPTSKIKMSSQKKYKVVLFSDEQYSVIDSRELDCTYVAKLEDAPIAKGIENGKYVKLNKSNYKHKEKIDVSFSGVTNKDAWFGLYPNNTTSYQPCSSGMWRYAATGTICGINNASNIRRAGKIQMSANALDIDTGTAHNLPKGTYKIVLFDNGGYTPTITSEPFTIS